MSCHKNAFVYFLLRLFLIACGNNCSFPIENEVQSNCQTNACLMKWVNWLRPAFYCFACKFRCSKFDGCWPKVNKIIRGNTINWSMCVILWVFLTMSLCKRFAQGQSDKDNKWFFSIFFFLLFFHLFNWTKCNFAFVDALIINLRVFLFRLLSLLINLCGVIYSHECCQTIKILGCAISKYTLIRFAYFVSIRKFRSP